MTRKLEKLNSTYVLEEIETLTGSKEVTSLIRSLMEDNMLVEDIEEGFDINNFENHMLKTLSEVLPEIKLEKDVLLKRIKSYGNLIDSKNNLDLAYEEDKKILEGLRSSFYLKNLIDDYLDNIRKLLNIKQLSKTEKNIHAQLNISSYIDQIFDAWNIDEKYILKQAEDFVLKILESTEDKEAVRDFKENGNLKKLLWVYSRYMFFEIIEKELQKKDSHVALGIDKKFCNIDGVISTAIQVNYDELRRGNHSKLLVLCQYLDWDIEIETEIIKHVFSNKSLTQDLIRSSFLIGDKFNSHRKKHQRVVLNYLLHVDREDNPKCLFEMLCSIIEEFYYNNEKTLEVTNLKKRLNYKKSRDNAKDGRVFNLWNSCEYILNSSEDDLRKALRVALWIDNVLSEPLNPAYIKVLGHFYDIVNYESLVLKELKKIGIQDILSSLDDIIAYEEIEVPELLPFKISNLKICTREFYEEPTLANELALYYMIPFSFVSLFNDLSLRQIHNLK